MSFLKRLRDVAQSLSFDNPEQHFKQVLADMKQLQSEARIEVTQAMAKGKRLERSYQRQVAELGQYHAQAENALMQDQEDLARAFLKRKRTAEALAESLKQDLADHKEMLKSLKMQLAELAVKIEEAQDSQNLFLNETGEDEIDYSQKSRARAQVSAESTDIEEELAALKAKLKTRS